MSPPITLEAIRLSGTSRPRLDAISLTFTPGITAVMGASGAGKTSLLNVLVGFEEPLAGTMDTSGATMGWVPSGLGLWPGYTVGEHLEAVAGSINERLLRDLGLEGLTHSRPEAISLGQQTRLAVARALATEASWLIMDEPLAHLEGPQRRACWAVIRRWLEGRSLVFASHEAETVLSQAEQVCCLADGRIAFVGSVDALYHSPETETLAQVLGHTNWIPDAAERKRWLGEAASEAGPSIRPERLDLQPHEAGPLVFHGRRCYGPVMESTLEDAASGAKRTFSHRGRTLPTGDGWRAMLRWLGILLITFGMGCERTEEWPTLTMAEVNAWRLPIDGPKLPAPRSVAVGPHDEIVALDDAGRVLVFDAQGKVIRRWRMPDISVGRPEGVVVLDQGDIVVCDTHYHQIITFSPEGEEKQRFGKSGRGPGEFIYPVAITKDPKGHLYVGEYGSNDRIQKFTLTGEHILSFGTFGTEPGAFQRPSGIVWHADRLYIADAVNNRLQIFHDDGRFDRVLPLTHDGQHVPLHLPYDLVMSPHHHLVLIEYGAGRILQCDLSGNLLGTYGRQGSAIGQFSTPWGITVDSRGRFRVADQGNRRLVALAPAESDS